MPQIFSLQNDPLNYNSFFSACILTYTPFLIPVGQKRLRPTLVSMYNYVQPIVATIISIIIGLDHITWKKLVAMVLVFAGVWIVNQSRAAAQPTPSGTD